MIGWFLHFHIQAQQPSDLYTAAVHSNNAKVSELLAAGADANNYYGISPLAAAAQRGNLEIVELLLRAGAQVTNSRYGNKPLLSATLQISYTHPTPSLEILQRLLRYGANVDERAMNGDSALHWAAASGQIEVVKFLIAAGANVNAAACDGETPLIKAAQRSHLETVKILIDAKASVLARNSTGRTAFDTARTDHKNYKEIMDSLSQSRVRTIPEKYNSQSCNLPMKVMVMKEWGDQHSIPLSYESWQKLYSGTFAIIVFSWLTALILGALSQDETLIKMLVLPTVTVVGVLVLWVFVGILTLKS